MLKKACSKNDSFHVIRCRFLGRSVSLLTNDVKLRPRSYRKLFHKSCFFTLCQAGLEILWGTVLFSDVTFFRRENISMVGCDSLIEERFKIISREST